MNFGIGSGLHFGAMNSFFGKFDKSHCLLAIAIATLSFVVLKIIDVPRQTMIKAKVTVNAKNIKTLDQKREVKLERTLYFPSLNFPGNKYLRHKNGEIVGFNANYFIDFSCTARVNKTGSYTFAVETDDGFRLRIDGIKLGQFLRDRPSKRSTHEVVLTKGDHLIELQYFQGHGNTAAVVEYKAAQAKEYQALGINSPNIEFIPVK